MYPSLIANDVWVLFNTSTRYQRLVSLSFHTGKGSIFSWRAHYRGVIRGGDGVGQDVFCVFGSEQYTAQAQGPSA